jgi:L-threo-3-deoxy-hexylosonate aldolase
MVILPAYYAASLNTDQEQVLQYFIDICQGSPVSYQAKINATSLTVSLT